MQHLRTKGQNYTKLLAPLAPAKPSAELCGLVLYFAEGSSQVYRIVF